MLRLVNISRTNYFSMSQTTSGSTTRSDTLLYFECYWFSNTLWISIGLIVCVTSNFFCRNTAGIAIRKRFQKSEPTLFVLEHWLRVTSCQSHRQAAWNGHVEKQCWCDGKDTYLDYWQFAVKLFDSSEIFADVYRDTSSKIVCSHQQIPRWNKSRTWIIPNDSTTSTGWDCGRWVDKCIV